MRKIWPRVLLCYRNLKEVGNQTFQFVLISGCSLLFRRRHYDEDVVRDLENQIKLLKSALRSRSVGDDEAQHVLQDTISMSNCERPSVKVQTPDYGLENGTPVLSPGATSVDSRSKSAMEELASLMLEMDIEEKGEPSFNIAAGKRMAAEVDYQHPSPEAVVSSGHRQGLEPQIPQVSKELLEHLMDCFVTHFNGFHQFLDAKDIEDIKTCGVDVDIVDCRFRNAALLAVAAHFSSREDAKQAGQGFSTIAQDLPLYCMKHRPSDLVVQGLALLAWQELMFGVQSLAYTYTCMFTSASMKTIVLTE